MLTVLVLLASLAFAELRQGSVKRGSDGKWEFSTVLDKTAPAYGTYSTSDGHQSGFGVLTLNTSESASPADQFAAAGFLEASLTPDVIADHASNWLNWFKDQMKNGSIPSSYDSWFSQQEAWVRQQMATNQTDLWQAVSLVMAQYDGLEAGYAAQSASGKYPSFTHFQMYGVVQSMGDLLTLMSILGDAEQPDPKSWSPERIRDWAREHSHCSALVKVSGDMQDLYMSQVAWFTYASMERIAKAYNFGLDQTKYPGKSMLFSSYGSLLSSLDDFYTMPSSKLVMLQTTNNLFNKNVLNEITYKTVLSWQRVRAANLMSTTGEQWCQICAAGAFHDDERAGTYNNQYMVINTGLFTPGKALLPGTLWVTEQIPGLVVAEDRTSDLERGYWPSYNVPYFDAIYNASGYPEVKAAHEEAWYSSLAGLDYQLAPRAQIFRRDQGKIDNFTQFRDFMRTNNYRTDPIAKGDPWNAICSRGDLASSPSPDGCYDGKATTAQLVAQGKAYFVNGPTTSQGNLPPFSWVPPFNTTPHQGQPHTFEFQWEEISLGN